VSTFLAFAALAFCWHYEISHPKVRKAPCTTPQVKWDDAQLQNVFNSLNQIYFFGQLKNVSVSWGDSGEGNEAMTHQNRLGHYDIHLNADDLMTERQVVSDLLHESCHVATLYKYKRGDDVHGADFQNCMFTLANRGAFHDVW